MSWACVKVDGPGLGVVTFADEDLSHADASWYCVAGDTAVDTARALKIVEEELYKLAVRVTDL